MKRICAGMLLIIAYFVYAGGDDNSVYANVPAERHVQEGEQRSRPPVVDLITWEVIIVIAVIAGVIAYIAREKSA